MRQCSADYFMMSCESGVTLHPSDTDYKVYVGDLETVFYFFHLTKEQRLDFLWMVNRGVARVGAPGYFPVAPFFTMNVREA